MCGLVRTGGRCRGCTGFSGAARGIVNLTLKPVLELHRIGLVRLAEERNEFIDTNQSSYAAEFLNDTGGKYTLKNRVTRERRESCTDGCDANPSLLKMILPDGYWDTSKRIVGAFNGLQSERLGGTGSGRCHGKDRSGEQKGRNRAGSNEPNRPEQPPARTRGCNAERQSKRD